MHRLLIAIAVAFVATNAQAQLGGRLSNPDADRDGRVTRAEFKATQAGRQARAFGLLDRDKDGRMSAAELGRAPRIAPLILAMDATRTAR